MNEQDPKRQDITRMSFRDQQQQMKKGKFWRRATGGGEKKLTLEISWAHKG